ncbi:hypothetical protein [Kitasatospora viridis]|uniref:Uncharacterized protein n=1 Tax=Kitasatospora viridis TaxID=281105 RepID=A0A561UD69_9ACTN|nr:hypothetical protein [Kitasatospora viridis]TWF97285.1 hypothetical protein FHX73_111065 [Kitasatospora viridis]
MTTRYQLHLNPHRIAADHARIRLRAALGVGGLVLPSLGLDEPSLLTGHVLVELGRATPETVLRMADLLLSGFACADR